jgi:hypothetical protein
MKFCNFLDLLQSTGLSPGGLFTLEIAVFNPFTEFATIQNGLTYSCKFDPNPPHKEKCSTSKSQLAKNVKTAPFGHFNCGLTFWRLIIFLVSNK